MHKIAFLNIMKHQKRSLVVIIAVCLAVLTMEFASGIIDGMKTNGKAMLRDESGDIQIHAEGYSENTKRFSLDKIIDNPDHIIEQLRQTKNVTSAEKVMYFGSMLVHNDKSVKIIGIGIQDNSGNFSSPRKNIKSGKWISGKNGIVISTRIGKLLSVNVGDTIVILVNDVNNSPYYTGTTIIGMYSTGSDKQDEMYYYLSHDYSADLLGTNASTMEIRVQLDDPDKAEVTLLSLGKFLKDKQLEGITWETIHGQMMMMIKFTDIFFLFVNIIIAIVAMTVIINTVLISVFERIREFGTLRAIGMKKSQLRNIILLEGLTLGLIGGVCGLIIGIPVVVFFKHHGIEIGAVGDEFSIGSIYYFAFSLKSAIVNMVFGLLIVGLCSLYGGRIVNKLQPVEALSYV